MKQAMVVLAATAFVVGGCGSDTINRGFVQNEWSQNLRELGIVPVFPPREDVVVGDVYATAYDPDDVRMEALLAKPWEDLCNDEKRLRMSIGMNSRLARLDFNSSIDAEYRRTLSASATSPDYNGILGNPALAAADDKVKAAEAKLKQLKDEVDKASEADKAAQADLLNATRGKEDADTAVAAADAKLTAAKAKPVDVSAQEVAVNKAKDARRTAARAAANAQLAYDLETDATKKASLKLDLDQKLREKANADTDFTEAQEDLDAAKLKKPDVTKEEDELAKAKAMQTSKTADQKTAQRKKEDADAASAAIAEKQKGPIEEAGKAVEAAKAVRTAIAEAGAKMLYPQPRDARSSVYSARALPNPVVAGAEDIGNSRVNRLRIVAFPEFATANYTQGDLSALIPIEALAFGINFSSRNVAKVSVKVPSAESYGLSIQEVLPSLLSSDVDDSAKTADNAARTVEEKAAALDAARLATESLKLAVASAQEDLAAAKDNADAQSDQGRSRTDKLEKLIAALNTQLAAAQQKQNTAKTEYDDAVSKEETAATKLAAETTKLLADSTEYAIAFVNAKKLNLKPTPALVRLVAPALAQNGLAIPATQPTTKPCKGQKHSSPAERKVYFRVITEVFYARALDVSVFSANSLGGRGQLSAPTVKIGAQTSTTQPSNVPAMAPNSVNAGVVGSGASAELLSGVQSSLGTTQAVPGGSVQLVSYSESSVGLRRVFDRPVALGFRGLLIEYDVDTGTITRISGTAGTLPLNALHPDM